jgi:hypothetical protein
MGRPDALTIIGGGRPSFLRFAGGRRLAATACGTSTINGAQDEQLFAAGVTPLPSVIVAVLVEQLAPA